MPERIRRMRTKGWKMPANALTVTRPTRWGNPFRVGVLNPPRWYWVGRRWHQGAIGATLLVEDPAHAVALFRRLANDPHFIWDARRELAGFDLACWCALGAPCHGDVLLEIANGGAS